LSPWPESLYAFDQMWGRLAQHAHLLAVDLPGFGHSERRDSLLAPRAMGEVIIRLADEFGLENPHAVGPDIGTGALLFAAADNPGRLRSIVLGSGGASFPLELGGILNDWVVAPDVEGYRAVDPRQIVSAALSGIERYELPDSVREDYLSAYDGDLESMRYVRPRRAADPGRAPSADRDAGRDGRGPVGLGRTAEQPPLPPPTPAQQQARPDRRGPLHLGGRRRAICGDRHQLVEWGYARA
jgi:pimeloyl-ACP methyl ester carboxylesterase